MIKENDFQKAVELIEKSQNILITTHIKPDGDACGSMAAIYEALAALGKKAQVLLLTELPQWYEHLFTQKPMMLKDFKQNKPAFDLLIIVDTNSYSQLEGLEDFLKPNKKPVLVIDHHPTSDNLGNIELVDSDAAAAGLIVFDLLRCAKWPITKKIAESLFVAIASDTGWFQFRNTDSRVYKTCAELIDKGAEPTDIYHNLFHNFSPSRLKLKTAMLGTLQLHFEDRYAEQYLTQDDFKKTGASYKDTENFIDECRRIKTVEAAALFVEMADGRIKCSMRSNNSVDVCKIAQKFGGGGHTAAAGTHLPGPLQNAMQIIKAEVEKQLIQKQK